MRRFAPVFAAVLTLLAVSATPASAYSDYTSSQWALQRISAAAGWQVSKGDGITVGVVDTGADAGHPEFGGRVSTVDCTGGSCKAGGDDLNGHGTHVTGIIGAAADGSGTTGVAPDIHVIVAKVFVCDSSACDSPSATNTDVAAGVSYLLSQHVAAINLSLGDPGFVGTGTLCNNNSFRDLAQQMWDGGSVGVFAAGNCGGGLLGGSALGNANALIVGATGPNDERSAYTSDMSSVKWGLAAPGGDPSGSNCKADGTDCVLSTWPRSRPESNSDSGPYRLEAGTSMAAPHVTAAVGALRAAGLSRDAAVNAIMSNLDQISCGAGCQGRLNLQRALGAAPMTTAPPAPTNQNFSAGATPRTTTTRKATPRTTPAPATAVTAAPTTTVVTEPPTTTTVAPPEVKAQSALKKPTSHDDSGPGALPVVVAIAGLLAAGLATGAAAYRRRKTVTTLP